MWHGDKDMDVPVEAADYLKGKIGHTLKDFHILQGENHTLIRRHWLNILQELTAAAKANIDAASSGGSSNL